MKTTVPYLTLTLAQTTSPLVANDAARAMSVRTQLQVFRPLLYNISSFRENHLQIIVSQSLQPITLGELGTIVRERYSLSNSINSLIGQLEAYAAINPPVIHANDVMEAIEGLVSAHTYSTTNPDGPIRRLANGAYLPGSFPPVVSGTPTERLLWLALYHQLDGHDWTTLSRLTEQISSCAAATRSALKGLVARGIAEAANDEPPLLFIRLERIHSRHSADDRVEWQSGRPSPASIAYAAEAKAAEDHATPFTLRPRATVKT